MAMNKRFELERNSSQVEDGDQAPNEMRNFDPARHIVRLRGGDYLEVKWRLLWLRTEHPHAHIETEMVHYDPENRIAVFKARVTIPDGGTATGWGSETSDDFKDYIEKAETKAIGRALASCGFGTQFCQDYDYESVSNKVVDAPVAYPSTNGFNRANGLAPISGGFSAGSGGNATAGSANSSLATEKQVKFIFSTGREQGLSEEQVTARCKEKFGVEPDQLTKTNASRFIDLLKQPA